jgi:hypothetical protein
VARLSKLTRLILLLAALKTAAGLAAFCLTAGSHPGDYVFPYWLYLTYILPFAGAAALLLLGGREDHRAVLLGGWLLTVATVYCNHPLGVLADAAAHGGHGTVRLAILTVSRLECFAFSPYLLWAFTRDFPLPPISVWMRRALDLGCRLSALLGIFLFTGNLVYNVVDASTQGAAAAALAVLKPMRGGGLFFEALVPALTLALPFLLWKAGHGVAVDQRRTRSFLWSVVLGFGPMMILTLVPLFSQDFHNYYLVRPWLQRRIAIGLAVPTNAVPFACAYAVLVFHVMEMKLIARRALQYVLARYSAITLAAVPVTLFCWYIYQHRNFKVVELSGRSHVLLLLGLSAAGVATLSYRKRLLDWIDRRFFREQYDARKILTELIEHVRAAGDGLALAKLIARDVDAALHLESVAFMIVDPRTGMLIDPRERGRRLDASSTLVNLICGAADPLTTDLEDARSPLARLPDKERHWLVDSGCRLVVPMLARDGLLLGMIGLGEKKSGLPFLKEDRQLLRAIASSAAWVLEIEPSRSTAPGTPAAHLPAVRQAAPAEAEVPAAQLAKECAKCGALFQAHTVLCTHCSRRLEPAHVPYVLPGKFRFEQRIGIGGMGVVYRGTDLALGRPVAVKTLRRVSPEDAMRLRREARTAAAVTQLHLASIYGIETWQGTPMLILELLEGGTLAHRLERERLLALETVELGICMAGALARLHAADILHRDIKPTNIGFTRDGTPKLMDFGIARVMFDLRRDQDLAMAEGRLDHSSLLLPTSIWNQTPSSASVSEQQLAGTLGYLSPEALNGHRADVSFDLWALAIVLYECLLGRKVFGGGDVRQLMSRIRLGRVPDFAQICPEHDDSLGDFFRCALHRTLARRPASALDFKQRLEAARLRLAA